MALVKTAMNPDSCYKGPKLSVFLSMKSIYLIAILCSITQAQFQQPRKNSIAEQSKQDQEIVPTLVPRI
jgi:hypothetical protein